MAKTLAEIAHDRFDRALNVFAGEVIDSSEYPNLVRQLVPSPQATWTKGGNRPHVLETAEFDDGSHLDVLRGVVFAW